MPQITLPDGSHRSFDHPVTVMDVASDIGPGLARATLAGRVDGKLVDASYTIENDAQLAIVTERDEDGLEVIRHSTAHLLAQAVKELFPETQVTIGPVIEDGFYYDFARPEPFTEADLAKKYGVDKIPAIILVCDRDYGIRFYGVPAGYEFAALVEDIKDVGGRDPGLSKEVMAELAKVDQPVHMQVLISPT